MITVILLTLFNDVFLYVITLSIGAYNGFTKMTFMKNLNNDV